MACSGHKGWRRRDGVVHCIRRADRSRCPAERRRGAAADAADGAAPTGRVACRERQAAAADPAPHASAVRSKVRAVEPGPAAIRLGGVGANYRCQRGRAGGRCGRAHPPASRQAGGPQPRRVTGAPAALRGGDRRRGVAIAPAAATSCIRSASCAPNNSISPRRNCGSGSPGGRATRAAAARMSCRWRQRRIAPSMAACRRRR